ncbi:MAG: FMN-binding protein [Myxococcota bacterium]|nr:FMN-binding protein [Myxococcota bacterium]
MAAAARFETELKIRSTWEKSIAAVALLFVASAWFLGRFLEESPDPQQLVSLVPGATNLVPLEAHRLYSARNRKQADVPLGYVGLGRAAGYAGPLSVAVGLNPQGVITGIRVLEERETLAFYRKLTKQKFPQHLIGRTHWDIASPARPLDAITGATISSTGVALATRRAVQQVGKLALNHNYPPVPPVPVSVGLLEIVFLSLLGFGLTVSLWPKKRAKAVRWFSLATGLVLLGFAYKRPLTLVNLNSLLLGYWPNWRSALFWYLILAGVLLPVIFVGKTPYCDRICPFGAAQEVMGHIGGAKKKIPPRIASMLSWLPRMLALGAIVGALILRDPGITSYEVSGTLFGLTGAPWQFVLLAVVLLASLVVRRPWCRFLCPVRAVVDYLAGLRHWLSGHRT